MESAPQTPAPAYSAQNTTRAPAAARPQDKAEPATTFLFYGYLFMILLEYTGIPNDFPVLKAVRATTVLNFGLFVLAVARIGFGDLMKHRQSKIVLAFIIFTAMSVIWAVVRVRAFNEIRPFVDYAIFFVLTALLVDRQKRFDMLSWTLLIVAAVLVARNLDKLSSSMRLGGFRAPYFMGDNNDFAWGCVVMMPIILNLAFGTRTLFTRLAGLGGALICIVGIIGSGSRGGTLGLGAAILFYWLVMSQHKARGALGVVVVALGVLAFAPASYFQRMGTVSTYEEDNSAKGRLQVWGASIRMATDRPLGVGAGNFSAAYGRFYMPAHSNMAWGGQRWLSAHSIYFRVLGEYGFIGLGMLLWLIITNIRDNIAIRRRLLAETAPAIPATWPALVNMGVIGFAVCGTFLGGITYPHLFMLSGLTIVAKRYVASLDPPPPVAPKGRRR
jgi:probable O-glycosylation ligase (exosortase A-associated)